MTDNKDKNVLNSSIEREQNDSICSAESEKIKGSKNLNVPALRFPEFSGEWHKHSLGEIGETIIGLTYKPSDVVADNGIIVLRSSNIKNGVIDYSDLVRVNKHVKDRIITKENDILVCSRNGSQRLIGKNAIIKREDINNTFGAFMMVYRSNDNPFILPLLSTRRYISQVGENLGARINQITTSDFNGFEFYFPENHVERAKIAELFRLLDERIATQNKIIEDLRLLRDAIMVEHYRKCNKSELCIYDIGEPFNVMNLSKDDLTKDGSPCIIYGELFTTYGCVIEKVVSHTTKSPNSTLSTKGDLLFPASTTVDALSLIAPSSINEDGIILGGDMFGIHVDEQYNSNYLSYYFNIIGKKNLAKYAKGSTIIHLHYADIQKAKITLPNKNEQEAVANLLLKVEHKLNIEQKMLINYLNTKNFLLRQMFI